MSIKTIEAVTRSATPDDNALSPEAAFTTTHVNREKSRLGQHAQQRRTAVLPETDVMAGSAGSGQVCGCLLLPRLPQTHVTSFARPFHLGSRPVHQWTSCPARSSSASPGR